MGRVLKAADEKWLAVVGKFWKVWKIWTWLGMIMGREGAIPRVPGIFFQAVVQAVLLFDSETWVTTPCMGRALGRFQHSVNRRIIGRQPKKMNHWGWEYTPPETAIEEAGFGGDGSLCPEEA